MKTGFVFGKFLPLHSGHLALIEFGGRHCDVLPKLWLAAFKKMLPDAHIVFTSEKYGDNVASSMGIEHLMYDNHRLKEPISGTAIRNAPFLHWHMIAPAARSYFVSENCFDLAHGADLNYVNGNWEERFEQAIRIIKKKFSMI